MKKNCYAAHAENDLINAKDFVRVAIDHWNDVELYLLRVLEKR